MKAIPGTDLANVELFIEKYGKELRYARGKGWLKWDGKRWADSGDAVASAAAVETSREIQKRAGEIQDPIAWKEANKWARQTQNAARLTAMPAIAASQPPIAATYSDFDNTDMGFNCASGLIDLRTGKLYPHDPGYLCTRISPAEYGLQAKSERWDEFIEQITCGDRALAAYLQRVVGYCLTGSVRDKCFFFCYGARGDNGKSVFIETINELLGDYALALNRQALIKHKFGKQGPSNDIAQLAGPRLATVSETAVGEEWDDAIIKDLTGGDKISARFLHKENFTFRPKCKLLIRGNNKPEITDPTSAMWRRIHLIPFNAHFTEEQQDKQLLQKLIRRDLSGILSWAVEGCLAWDKMGLCPPDSVMSAVTEYRDEQDTLGLFLRECCEYVPGIETRASALHGAYQKWAFKHGQKSMSLTAFGTEMSAKNYSKVKNYRGIAYENMRLIEGELLSENPALLPEI